MPEGAECQSCMSDLFEKRQKPRFSHLGNITNAKEISHSPRTCTVTAITASPNPTTQTLDFPNDYAKLKSNGEKNIFRREETAPENGGGGRERERERGEWVRRGKKRKVFQETLKREENWQE